MLEEFVGLGEWWLPSQPEVKLQGRLNFIPGKEVTLELNGSFYNSIFEEAGQPGEPIPAGQVADIWDETRGVALKFIRPEEIIILGTLDNNEDVTLYKCFGRVKNVKLIGGKSVLSFRARYIFRKIHFQNEEDVRFKSISSRYFHLEQWVGISGVRPFRSPDDNTVWISYKPPSDIQLAQIDGLDLSVTFSKTYFNPLPLALGATYYEGSVEQINYLTIYNPEGKPIDESINLLTHFRDLLSFAMSKSIPIVSVSGIVDVPKPKCSRQADGMYLEEEETQEAEVTILFGLWNNIKSSGDTFDPYDMLFLFDDTDGKLGEILQKWIEKKTDEYKPVFDLLLDTMYHSSLYLYHSFLNTIQALEAYCNSKKSKRHYKLKLEEIIEKNLKGISHLLPENFIGDLEDRKEFSKRASYTRNALTHYDNERYEKAAKGKELFSFLIP
ncbi:HEPN domain-containing protein [Oculatella sp. FACHB-28]|uniref:ApeA N-terminal domain 1-containing protein n=1 Tax=Oculatella sp. FACHB-28 TaxID=2692845 RepID=UPI0018EF8044|nr:HEPN domain-containing protein [Oculatella sp. FACHB-28]